MAAGLNHCQVCYWTTWTSCWTTMSDHGEVLTCSASKGITMSWSSQSGGKATHGGYDSPARHRLEEAFKCNLAVLARDLQSLTVTDLHFKKTYNVIKYLQSPQCKRGFCEFREENATSSFPVLHHPSLFNTTAGVSQTYMSKFWTSWARPADVVCFWLFWSDCAWGRGSGTAHVTV